MRPLLVLVTGEPVASAVDARGDFGMLIRQAAPRPVCPWLTVDARQGGAFPDPRELSGVVITGSAASLVEPEPWMEPALAYVRQLVEQATPVFGICFGHQMLGAALGGKVARNPRGREFGTVGFTLAVQDPIVGVPGTFPVNASHLDSVTDLPMGSQVLGWSELEPHAAVRFGAAAWGVQFHPEFDRDVLRHYYAARRGALEQEGFDVEAGLARCQDTPEAALMIGRFAAWAGSLASR